MKKGLVRMPLDDQLLEVRQCNSRAHRGNLLRLHQAPHHLQDLDVDQMWSMQTLRWMECAGSDALRPRRPENQLDSSRRIEDDQLASRSSRSTWVGDSFPR